MSKKLPYFPFYPGDWLKDAKLSLCAPATRGVWMDLLCAMHELDRVGELRGTAEQLARTARCLPVDLVQALTDLRTTGAADVTDRNGVYRVCNRRMRDDYQKRKANSAKQIRRRRSSCRAPCNPNVTPLYEDEIESEFETFWKTFPNGRKNSKAKAREAFARALQKPITAAELIAAAAEYAASEVGRGPFVKMPTTWLNQECWADDREAWKAKDATAAPPPRKEYRTITPQQFKAHRDADEFLTRPLRDRNDATRWFGTLRNNRKVECFLERTPDGLRET